VTVSHTPRGDEARVFLANPKPSQLTGERNGRSTQKLDW
jgi:hypothetical protein